MFIMSSSASSTKAIQRVLLLRSMAKIPSHTFYSIYIYNTLYSIYLLALLLWDERSRTLRQALSCVEDIKQYLKHSSCLLNYARTHIYYILN